jgi:hypothetical protein
LTTDFLSFFPKQLSFKSAQQGIGELRGKLRHLLGLPVPGSQRSSSYNQHQPPATSRSLLDGDVHCMEESPLSSPHSAAAAQMEHHITTYLCKTSGTFEVSEIIFVSSNA